MASSALCLLLCFNFRSIEMHQTHSDTHLSHLQHAFERLKHLFWFGLSKVLAINSGNDVSQWPIKKHVQQTCASVTWWNKMKKVLKLCLLNINLNIFCLSHWKLMSLLHFPTCKIGAFPQWTGLSAGSVYWCWKKIPPWSVHRKSFNSLNEVHGISDLFEFFEHLQGIVDIN